MEKFDNLNNHQDFDFDLYKIIKISNSKDFNLNHIIYINNSIEEAESYLEDEIDFDPKLFLKLI